jgi:Tfp pilus assembly ATPase PilU
MIRKGKTFQIPSIVATSRESGMQLMDNELMRLYKEGKISADEAYLRAAVKKEFEEIVAKEKEQKVARIPESGGANNQSPDVQGAGANPVNAGESMKNR